MNELLNKINQTFDNSINVCDAQTALQLKILKGNINSLFKDYMEDQKVQATPLNIPVAPQPSVQPKPVAPAPRPIVDTPVQGPKKNIMIVDDSSIIRNYLQKTVSNKYDVTSVSSGADAIETIPNKKIDLILLDLMMPGIDGFGVLDYLKENNNRVPVVIISGDTTKETIDRAFKYNVVDMIEKPFSDKVILEKIDRILG